MAREEEWEDKDWGDFMWGKETKPFLDFEVAPGIELRMHQNLAGGSELSLGSAEGLHTTVWEAAIALHLYILREERHSPGCWRGKRVLELGAGTGLVGLTLAACGATVVLTELEVALPLLRHNVNANAATVATAAAGSLSSSSLSSSSSPTPPKACALEWGTAIDVRTLSASTGNNGTRSVAGAEMKEEAKIAEEESSRTDMLSNKTQTDAERQLERGLSFDIVVGADIVYGEELFPILLHALNQVCDQGTELLLCRLQRGTDREKIERFYHDGLVRELGFTQFATILVGGATEGQKVKGPSDDQFSKNFATMSDQKLPFELVRAVRGTLKATFDQTITAFVQGST